MAKWIVGMTTLVLLVSVVIGQYAEWRAWKRVKAGAAVNMIRQGQVVGFPIGKGIGTLKWIDGRMVEIGSGRLYVPWEDHMTVDWKIKKL